MHTHTPTQLGTGVRARTKSWPSKTKRAPRLLLHCPLPLSPFLSLVLSVSLTSCSCPGRKLRWSHWAGCRPEPSAAASRGRPCPSCRGSWTGAASAGPTRPRPLSLSRKAFKSQICTTLSLSLCLLRSSRSHAQTLLVVVVVASALVVVAHTFRREEKERKKNLVTAAATAALHLNAPRRNACESGAHTEHKLSCTAADAATLTAAQLLPILIWCVCTYTPCPRPFVRLFLSLSLSLSLSLARALLVCAVCFPRTNTATHALASRSSRVYKYMYIPIEYTYRYIYNATATSNLRLKNRLRSRKGDTADSRTVLFLSWKV